MIVYWFPPELSANILWQCFLSITLVGRLREASTVIRMSSIRCQIQILLLWIQILQSLLCVRYRYCSCGYRYRYCSHYSGFSEILLLDIFRDWNDNYHVSDTAVVAREKEFKNLNLMFDTNLQLISQLDQPSRLITSQSSPPPLSEIISKIWISTKENLWILSNFPGSVSYLAWQRKYFLFHC